MTATVPDQSVPNPASTKQKIYLHVGGRSQPHPDGTPNVEATRADISDDLIAELDLVLGELIGEKHPAFATLYLLYAGSATFPVTLFVVMPDHDEE